MKLTKIDIFMLIAAFFVVLSIAFAGYAHAEYRGIPGPQGEQGIQGPKGDPGTPGSSQGSALNFVQHHLSPVYDKWQMSLAVGQYLGKQAAGVAIGKKCSECGDALLHMNIGKQGADVGGGVGITAQW